ncbi:hypothetical protein SAMN03159341_101745 [Paenibacillus sp. 1_12]|uniref:hypothetical protein n=1 Tax=Paenibacillus sp. 1_12 TaxID=1566278 RepID=UPI0008E29E03|nr:hypothetical protein [Paenibacillus sp. 1_12]SFK82417.1 hypothetical protein SAMN03159341_101745 [Paenibacillus sp. 1_12]
MTSSYFNEWLDEYNDYITLYEIFGDKEYLEEAREVLISLKAIVVRAENYQKILHKIMNGTINAS